MSGMDMYWLVKLDDIREFLCVIAAFGFVFLILLQMAAIFVVLNIVNSVEDNEKLKTIPDDLANLASEWIKTLAPKTKSEQTEVEKTELEQTE